MVKINYISNGNWYVYNRNDIYSVYNLLREFYEDTLVSLYGESRICDLEYDKDLQVLKVRKYGMKWKNRRCKRIISLVDNTGLSERVSLLLNSLTASGILNAPFCSIRVVFSTSIPDIDKMKEKNHLITKEGYGRNRGYFSVKGAIY